jgi:hypothetical protein
MVSLIIVLSSALVFNISKIIDGRQQNRRAQLSKQEILYHDRQRVAEKLKLQTKTDHGTTENRK